jgi:hypothetical protein
MGAFAAVFVVGVRKWSYKLFFVDTEVISMPQKRFPFKVSTAKRLIGAVQGKGLTVKSVMAAPDGTLTISILSEVSPEADRQIDDIVENEWDDYGKPSAA